MKKTTFKGVEINADAIVVALIDQLLKTERRAESLQKQVNEQLEMIAELQPTLCANGDVIVRAMRRGETPVEHYVTLKSLSTQEI